MSAEMRGETFVVWCADCCWGYGPDTESLAEYEMDEHNIEHHGATRSDAGSTTLVFLLTLTTLCAVAWFAVPNVPGVVEAMTVGVLRILGYAAVGCVGVAISWRWIERAL